MVSVGHRTGCSMSWRDAPRRTSAEIASRASLDERYVREWLAVMTTGRIVEHDGAADRTPARRSRRLAHPGSRHGQPRRRMQYIGLMALVEDQIVDCFRHGGGVPYSAFPAVPGGHGRRQRRRPHATLIDVTLAAGTRDDHRLGEGIEVADVGCGSATPST